MLSNGSTAIEGLAGSDGAADFGGAASVEEADDGAGIDAVGGFDGRVHSAAPITATNNALAVAIHAKRRVGRRAIAGAAEPSGTGDPSGRIANACTGSYIYIYI